MNEIRIILFEINLLPVQIDEKGIAAICRSLNLSVCLSVCPPASLSLIYYLSAVFLSDCLSLSVSSSLTHTNREREREVHTFT